MEEMTFPGFKMICQPFWTWKMESETNPVRLDVGGTIAARKAGRQASTKWLRAQ